MIATCRSMYRLQFCAAAVTLMLLGCGEGDPFKRVIVSGTVTYQGKPVEFGMIRFSPTGETRTPASGAYIKHGSYRIDQRGGVPVGTYQVMIEAFPGGVPQPTTGDTVRGVEDDPPKGNGPAKQYLPPRYNDRTNLTIEIVGQSGELNKNWDLTP